MSFAINLPVYVPACSLCGGQLQQLFHRQGHWIFGCETCGHQQATISSSLKDHVSETYDDDYFHGSTAGYPNYLIEGPLLRKHAQRYARLVARYCRPGTVLDVGAAAGFILRGFIDSGWNGVGIEPNPNAAQYGRRNLGVEITAGSFEEFNTESRFDLVAMIQVIAHFIDPLVAIQKASALLKPGGYLLIETWNRDSRSARFFGESWHEYNPPSVLHWFTPEEVQRLGAECRLRKIAQGRPRKWIAAIHGKSVLSGMQGTPAVRVMKTLAHVIPDTLAIPYPLDDLFWMILQKDAAGPERAPAG